MIERIRYFVKEGLRSIWRNRMMSFASILVLCVCLVMLGTSITVTLNINDIISQLEDKNQIMVYLKNDATSEDISRIGNEINSMANVKETKFFSKEDIYAEAKKTLDKQKVLLSGIDASVFDCAYQVTLVDTSKYTQTTDALEKIEGVKYVRQDEGLANKLVNIKKAVGISGEILFGILAVISLFIISNTIKLAMFNRKREINIMKFVGATDWFIRWPFIIEGLLIGLIAGGIGLIAQYYIYDKLICGVIGVVNSMSAISYSDFLWFIVPGFLVGGVLVGVLGSVLSVRKYLKV
ncbi:hypothetical protein CCDG5_0115 [[Clostridium] cellulosi]|uniref:Cell division protein FtsX n=1 Tax=[Clostridium] cellulosi TaxID=29343 RepID=A0A078KQ69_9FIRM|nr:MAG: ABC transporter permease [[Clostridium] cellulosi]CDZ23259.1 hypothetical protein CCDG5_0115 [[Clostridium] cellulosi]